MECGELDVSVNRIHITTEGDSGGLASNLNVDALAEDSCARVEVPNHIGTRTSAQDSIHIHALSK